MRRELVSSSVLVSVGYDPETRTLEVEFVSAEVYRYFDVDPVDVLALLQADSKGRYFNERIKPRYGYARVHS